MFDVRNPKWHIQVNKIPVACDVKAPFILVAT